MREGLSDFDAPTTAADGTRHRLAIPRSPPVGGDAALAENRAIADLLAGLEVTHSPAAAVAVARSV